MQQWGNDKMMGFNPEKYEVICITNKREITDADYSIHAHA